MISLCRLRSRRCRGHGGASLKDAGRLTFAVAKLGAEMIPGLLDSIRKATTGQTRYGNTNAH